MDPLRLGVDVGSTTAKVVVLDAGVTRFADYRRHNAAAQNALCRALEGARAELDNVPVSVVVTGSSGMGLGERFDLPFIQEAVASAEVLRRRYPDVRTLVDVGGEDAKLILLRPGGVPDIRMNGSCAGGTGAFIDQMAVLLGVSLPELDALAARHTTIHPIASRCGVFAKTDVQNLLSREIGREDIAASIFHAVALQILVTLARGSHPRPPVLFSGGPLTFLPALAAAFTRVLALAPGDLVEAERAELIPALGAALAGDTPRVATSLDALIALLETNAPHGTYSAQGAACEHRLAPLFADPAAFAAWQEQGARSRVPRVDLAELAGKPCFLGIDSGSTTTKLVLADAGGRVAFTRYGKNNGNAIGAVQAALADLRTALAPLPVRPILARTAVTGYGEDLIRTAFHCDEGLVETLAHTRAAQALDPEVTFILDIGGQDMKAIFLADGQIRSIEINEACSSGCGSFLETFAASLGYGISDFAGLACLAGAPCDMGTRCTVFMNSKVKQAQREGAGVDDISAGLAYSVIKNALHKVLKITDPAVLGDHILVQGGAFRNPGVQRALELLLGRVVTCPDITELMGAYGAALAARDSWQAAPRRSGFVDLAALETAGSYAKQQIHCRGCTNRCTVTKLTFAGGNTFYTGNRCERIYSNRGAKGAKGANLLEQKQRLLFERRTQPTGPPRLLIGLPRVLNMYERYPFWATLLVECGFAVRLSDPSTNTLYERGAGTVASENICFPAKLAHGHIFNLIDAGVDRIFYPMVASEHGEFGDADRTFNCPIVTGYPEVLRSTIDPEGSAGIPLDRPPLTCADPELLRRACTRYLGGLGADPTTIARAFARAEAAQAEYRAALRAAALDILARARVEGRLVVLVLSRPYHLDGLINHRIPDILADFGVDIITEDAVPLAPGARLDDPYTVTLWEDTNRLLYAARWAAGEENVEVVQLNSFGCGPDVIATDEVRAILAAAGKGLTVLRIDEIESLGSARLRLRSMVESVRARRGAVRICRPRRPNRNYTRGDTHRTILVPEFSLFATVPIIRPLRDMGFRVEILPPANRASVDEGLRCVNNEICYPAIVVIGDMIKALKSGRYPLAEVALAISQTGGQCRDSCYLPLLKKALAANNLAEVPVISLSPSFQPLNEQPGLRINYAQFTYKLMFSLALADALSAMYYAVAAREHRRGAALAVANRYLAGLDDGTIPLHRAAILAAIRAAAREFNAVAVRSSELPRAAIVGEIFLKLNSFANHRVAQWLMDQGIEVEVPPLAEYFTSAFVNSEADVRAGMRRRDLQWGVTRLVRLYVEGFLAEADAARRTFRFYRPFHAIEQIAEAARGVIDLTSHYGEGWLIPGEIGAYVETGVPNILCIQPFGCMANQVTARGLERRLKQRYPHLNLLYVDVDASASEVNIQNRLHFFASRALTGAELGNRRSS